MERRPSPWLDDLSGAATEGGPAPEPRAAAERFAALRANLRG